MSGTAPRRGIPQEGGFPIPVQGRGIAQLLVDGSVGPYVAAKLLSSIGVWIFNIVAAVVVYEATQSAFLVGAVSIAQFVPQIAIAPWMGAIADRGHRRSLVMVGRLLAATGGTGLALLTAAGGPASPPRADAVIGAALVIGVGFAISVPAMHALVPALVRDEELSAIVALDVLPFSLARAVGPALGGTLLLVAGPAVAFGVAGVSQLLIVLVIWRVRLRAIDLPAHHDGSVRSGVHYLRADRRTGVLLLAIAGVGFGVDPALTLAPPIAAGFGRGPELVAMLASAFGVGAGVGAIVLGSVRSKVGQGRAGVLGLALLALSATALAGSPTPSYAVAAMLLGGVGMMIAITSLTTQVQRRVPEALRGRVMAYWAVCFVGARPIAAAMNGFVADLWSPQAALLLLAVLLSFAAYAARPEGGTS